MDYTSDGATLFYTEQGKEQGKGTALVLLHPTPCDHRFWLSVSPSLTGAYRVILPDLRGHGQSELGEGPVTMERLAADLERLLDERDIAKALFAGCSIGGYALYELWRRIPARVIALGFLCSKPQADSAENRARREQWIAMIRERGTADFIDAMLGTLIGPTARGRAPEKIEGIRSIMQRVSANATVAVQQGLARRPDSVETASTIRVPAFVLAGGEDASSTPREMKLLAETIRNGGYGAEYHELKDAGHYAPWEQPKLVGRLLRRFFDSVV
jgi:3-oxoadipate enol-lactonase